MTKNPRNRPAFQRHAVSLTSLILVLVLIPPVLLIPAGIAWLWQQGWMLWWLGIGAVLTLTGYLIALWMRRSARPDTADTPDAEEPPVTPANDDWSPQDLDAWAVVQRLARETDKSILASQTLLLQRARVVIEAVAAEYYPKHEDPVWNFTLPEALLLTERVSQRLRLVLSDHVPAAQMFQVGQLMRLWQVRSSSMKYYKGAKLAYRFVRLVNPLSALLAEAREKILDVAMDSTSSYLRQKGARIWVEEVGRASIELYSGRLQIHTRSLSDLAAAEIQTTPPPGPVQVWVGGQVNVGKSSLVNALLQEARAAVDALPMTDGRDRYQLTDEHGEALAILTDAPGLTRVQDASWWGEHCAQADCILWVVAAHRADRHLDHHALRSIHDWFEAHPDRTRPPILLVISHVDRLSPAREWNPPYDLDRRDEPKARSIGEALEAIAEDLDAREEDLVPVRLDQGADGYNLDLLQALVEEAIEQAKPGRARRLQLMSKQHNWSVIVEQARSAGRFIKRAITR
ncbi:GTPase family protein [Saccharospirillum salsuginis]|uniref:G domain-containing protein n=1 Tax=Saccharospirillum salsuginis TaxID=418750 RepID=A0A918KT42_9GAMM|nr:GTPase domain-containing protein [Saccharospirillum salsuginis]GGX75034.1 hypothetical protein GCM10007392_47790 [Saccharospirillum salsuginis]